MKRLLFHPFRRLPARSVRLLLAALLLLATAGPVLAQPLTIPRFSFNLSNPGARSLGFGGAFAGLADDATAAYANPAGLVQLVRPEVSVEGRHWERSTPFLAGGRLDGAPTGIGIDTEEGLLFGEDASSETGLSFASVVYPKGRFSFALYGHRLASVDVASESQGFFFGDDELPSSFRFPATRERVQLDVDTLGLAAGWRATDRLSFGLAVVLADGSVVTSTAAYTPDPAASTGIFSEVTFEPELLVSSTRLSLEGTDQVLTGGMLWKITDRLSLGLFHRQGAGLSGDADLTTGPAVEGLPPGAVFPFSSSFDFPDVSGAGLAYRSGDGRLTLAAEADYVNYSGLIRIRDEEGDVVDFRDFEDAWEYHLGAEYAFLRARPIFALRAGVWREASGDDVLDGLSTHVSVGLGIAAPLGQVDFAFDFSDEIDVASLSFIYTF